MFSSLYKPSIMKSIKNTNSYPAGTPLISDDLIEFHASRILLLLRHCGKHDRITKEYKIEGLTKIAKLDFFIRYPNYFYKVIDVLRIDIADKTQLTKTSSESKMIRFHYGPWDERYYQLLPFLEARQLIRINKVGNSYIFYLTKAGNSVADDLSQTDEFRDLVNAIVAVSNVFKNKSGSYLKDLIYEVFDKEVASKKLNEQIQ